MAEKLKALASLQAGVQYDHGRPSGANPEGQLATSVSDFMLKPDIVILLSPPVAPTLYGEGRTGVG